MTRKQKIFLFLSYLALQTLTLFIFIRFPLTPFPGIVYENAGGRIIEHETHISLQSYLWPQAFAPEGMAVETISFQPLGWVLLFLILFVMPVLISFRLYRAKNKEKP